MKGPFITLNATKGPFIALRRLVLVAHGTRDPEGTRVVHELADRVRDRLPGTGVHVAFADVREPNLTAVLRSSDEPAVVVPAFLAAGYHVRVDLPAQARESGQHPTITPPLGPAPAMIAAAHDRLLAAGWRTGQPVVLAAAGSADPCAHADIRLAAARLAATLGTPVGIGYVATNSPRLTDVVGKRTAVASWLLAPGLFHRRARRSGAAVIAAPLGAHPAVADLVVERYRTAAMVPVGVRTPR